MGDYLDLLIDMIGCMPVASQFMAFMALSKDLGRFVNIIDNKWAT